MKEKIKLIRNEPFIFYPLLFGIIGILVGVIIIPFMLSKLPDLVPLFYSLPRTSERLAHKNYLFLFPLLSFVVWFVNFVCIFLMIKRDIVISIILSFSSLLVCLLSLYTLLRIIFLIA